jgi:hypothetical protein
MSTYAESNRVAFERWENYCEQDLTWKTGHLDEASYLAFLRAASLGISPGLARSEVIARLRGAHAPRLREDKIISQLTRAYEYVSCTRKGGKVSRRLSAGRFSSARNLTSQAIDFEVVDYLVSNGPPGGEILSQAPSRTEEIIDALFPGNPLLCVAKSKSQFVTRHREELRGKLGAMEFIVPSPMSARFGSTKTGHLSEHSLDNTGPRWFLVIEFDIAEVDGRGRATPWTSWIRKWKAQGRSVLDASAALLFNLTTGARAHRLTLIVHSGNKSLHGWFYCAGEHQGKLRAFFHRAVRLGADRQTWTRSQFVRMPDGRRADGRLQTVLYFNPETIKQ